MEALIESFEVVPTPPNTHVKISCAMVTFGNHLRFNFSNISTSTSFEKQFFRHLTDSGIPVKILKYQVKYYELLHKLRSRTG